ncbi:hypothetical protein BD410DRAFT_533365 [Rickenella mellea]|uniref:Uncharacterized protein n=1 Tax=Rickenella mellea TaxID=50990 RepID=A0A4Y7PTD1_9AGAM|nr:hypothetical protein BD410DRAFT_533365 [Rickenella mellea]
MTSSLDPLGRPGVRRWIPFRPLTTSVFCLHSICTMSARSISQAPMSRFPLFSYPSSLVRRANLALSIRGVLVLTPPVRVTINGRAALKHKAPHRTAYGIRPYSLQNHTVYGCTVQYGTRIVDIIDLILYGTVRLTVRPYVRLRSFKPHATVRGTAVNCIIRKRCGPHACFTPTQRPPSRSQRGPSGPPTNPTMGFFISTPSYMQRNSTPSPSLRAFLHSLCKTYTSCSCCFNYWASLTVTLFISSESFITMNYTSIIHLFAMLMLPP